MPKVVVDIFGADNSPHEIVAGCVLALEKTKDVSLVLTGSKELIEAELKKHSGVDYSRVEIVHASEVITNHDAPSNAIKQKLDSSLVKALERTKSDDDVAGMVSAGSTGAVLIGGIFKVGRIKGISRPALCPLLPTSLGGHVALIDGGSNVDCKPEFLTQFAMMGSIYAQSRGVENPRVGLVNVGVEDKKGNELTHAAFPLLKEMDINFVGNMEARDALSGNYDVLVADGFIGNVLLKSVEGTALMIMKRLKDTIMESTSAKIGAMFMKGAFKKFKGMMDYSQLGGAPFLGVEKILIKSHGSSKATSIAASIQQVIDMDKANLIEKIREGVQGEKKIESTQE
ncbi:MAG: phosphate acyltransferase PlsX [Firmicutes bacterium]|nr:phosphate acyltransferase PlsX [Bacillota bacterium]MCL2256420.1 phosphate acyltransferase PlsX [Bacillota bacterium]